MILFECQSQKYNKKRLKVSFEKDQERTPQIQRFLHKTTFAYSFGQWPRVPNINISCVFLFAVATPLIRNCVNNEMKIDLTVEMRIGKQRRFEGIYNIKNIFFAFSCFNWCVNKGFCATNKIVQITTIFDEIFQSSLVRLSPSPHGYP